MGTNIQRCVHMVKFELNTIEYANLSTQLCATPLHGPTYNMYPERKILHAINPHTTHRQSQVQMQCKLL